MAAKLLDFTWDNNTGKQHNNKLFPKEFRCVISGRSGSGKTLLAANMILNQWIDYKKLIIVSGSLGQPIY